MRVPAASDEDVLDERGFVEATWVVATPGGFAVVDRLSSSVAFYNDGGGWLGRVGSAGEGPGEFSAGILHAVAVADRLWVPDVRNRRLNVIDIPSRSWLDSNPLDVVQGYLRDLLSPGEAVLGAAVTSWSFGSEPRTMSLNLWTGEAMEPAFSWLVDEDRRGWASRTLVVEGTGRGTVAILDRHAGDIRVRDLAGNILARYGRLGDTLRTRLDGRSVAPGGGGRTGLAGTRDGAAEQPDWRPCAPDYPVGKLSSIVVLRSTPAPQETPMRRPAPFSERAERIVIAVICLDLVLQTAETLYAGAGAATIFFWARVGIWLCYTVEWCVRLRRAEDWRKYAFSFFGIVDFLAVLPLWAFTGFDLKALRAFRLFRLFVSSAKLAARTQAVVKLARAFRLAMDEAGALFAGTCIIVITAGFGMYHLEQAAQPDVFGSVYDGLWWAVVTLTTVGYGDIQPVTAGGRILATLAMFSGIGVIGSACGIMADALREAGTGVRPDGTAGLPGRMSGAPRPATDDGRA